MRGVLATKQSSGNSPGLPCVFFKNARNDVLIGFILALIFLSHAEAAALTLCPAGIKRCDPLHGDKAKYGECMALVCKEGKGAESALEVENKQQRAITEGMETCDNGLRRCDALRKDAASYWLCMEETCNSAVKEADPACDDGVKACQAELRQYKSCVGLICKNPPGTYVACEQGEKQCVASLRHFWQCVHKSCLGDTALFVKKAQEKKQKTTLKQEGGRVEFDRFGFEIRYDKDGKRIKPLLGAPAALRYPPPGVRPEDYTLDIMPGRLINKPASSVLECILPSARLRCTTNDIASCRCSDGTLPFYKQKKEYVFKEAPRGIKMSNVLMRGPSKADAEGESYYKNLERMTRELRQILDVMQPPR